ncbi:Holliday junction resolvase RecU [Paenibacillus humicus]|uniref:Holliday junction resolvase RecU n=1 Tax=Paenibacillus humicus TaxID=412861 RepID=UPI003D2CD98F
MSYANRGMAFEELITYANDLYEKKGIANIKKVSTPWKVIRKGSKIINAFPEGPSTVDYMGDWEGRSICFEAKSTKNPTSFPFKNFEDHQIEFIRRWKGIGFALIHFQIWEETYLITKEDLLEKWDKQFEGGKKSIPYQWFRENAKLVKQGKYALDYLAAVN